MKPIYLSQRLAFIIVILFASVGLSNAQSEQKPTSPQDLYKEIVKQDSILFNAFNTRNAELFKSMFTEDLEFFHDKGGLTGYDQTINFLKETTESKSDLKRELIKEGLEIYPIPGYGAMQIGSHKFCHTENGKQDCGTFRFVHIWQYKNGQWKITRVVSYDH